MLSSAALSLSAAARAEPSEAGPLSSTAESLVGMDAAPPTRLHAAPPPPWRLVAWRRDLVAGGDLQTGFMPNGVFHRIAAGALALSDSPKFGTAIERSLAYVVFDRELVMLQRLPRGPRGLSSLKTSVAAQRCKPVCGKRLVERTKP